MLELLILLMPLALAAAVQPPQIIAFVILMQDARGVVKGWAYLAGMTTFRLLLGVALWLLISRVEETIEIAGGQFDIFVGAVLMVLGLLLLVYALRRLLSVPGDAETAVSWLDKLRTATPTHAMLFGIAFLALDPKDWLIDISAVDLIAAADLSNLQSLLAYLGYIVMAQGLLLALLLLALVRPQQARALLAQLGAWLDRNERPLTVTVLALLGVFFVYSGLGRIW